jgi:ketosteroid isomerase-like protein
MAAVTRRSNAEIVAEYLDCVVRKDVTAVDRLFHPDIEYVISGSPLADRDPAIPPISAECISALPWLGHYRGKDALKAFLDHMHKNLEVTAYGERRVISQGDQTAAFGWFRLRSLSTGRSADIAYAIYVEVRDGLIVKYHFVENTFDVANTFRVGGAWKIDTDGAKRDVPSASR